jgi:tetratricopeptide (TPR) repeat protein
LPLLGSSAAIAQENLQDLNDVEYWRNLCDLQADAAQYAEAQKACEAAIELEPRNDGLWARHSGILFAQEQHPNAIASATQALRFNPENSLAFTYTCMAHFALGNLELALDNCNDALRVDGSWGNQSPALAWLHRGLILTDQGDPAGALVAYARTLLLEPEDARTLLHQCEAQLALQDYDSAIASCQQARVGNGEWGPTAPALAWLNQGIAEFERGNSTAAIAAFDGAVDLDPSLALAWSYQGRALAQQEQHTEALLSYNQAVALQPESARALVGQCAALNKTRQYEAAAAACEAALQASDGDWWAIGPAEAWTQYAQALAGQGQYEAALAASNRAIGLRPNYAAAHSDRGVVLWYLRQYDAAIAATLRAIELTQGNNVRYLINLGSIYRSIGDDSSALQTYNEALQIAPNSPNVLVNRSVVLWQLGRYPDALADATLAADLIARDPGAINDPLLVAALYNQGTALFSLGRYTEAGQAFNRAVNLDPENASVWAGLGAVLGQLGRVAEAREALTTALNLNPQLAIAQNLLNTLTGAPGNGVPSPPPAAP